MQYFLTVRGKRINKNYLILLPQPFQESMGFKPAKKKRKLKMALELE